MGERAKLENASESEVREVAASFLSIGEFFNQDVVEVSFFRSDFGIACRVLLTLRVRSFCSGSTSTQVKTPSLANKTTQSVA